MSVYQKLEEVKLVFRILFVILKMMLVTLFFIPLLLVSFVFWLFTGWKEKPSFSLVDSVLNWAMDLEG